VQRPAGEPGDGPEQQQAVGARQGIGGDDDAVGPARRGDHPEQVPAVHDRPQQALRHLGTAAREGGAHPARDVLGVQGVDPRQRRRVQPSQQGRLPGAREAADDDQCGGWWRRRARDDHGSVSTPIM
jgi:hypothetical protein